MAGTRGGSVVEREASDRETKEVVKTESEIMAGERDGRVGFVYAYHSSLRSFFFYLTSFSSSLVPFRGEWVVVSSFHGIA